MDNFYAMKVFTQTVESESLSAAGRELGLAPSSVSRWISELEREMGGRLLNRTTRKISLTDAGEAFYHRAVSILSDLDNAKQAVLEQNSTPSGTLKISVPASLVQLVIAPAIGLFQKKHPLVNVVVLVSDKTTDIISEGLDMAIRIGSLDDSSLVARKVGEGRRLACASPAYLAANGYPRDVEDLINHKCITFRSSAGANKWSFTRNDEQFDVQASGSFFTNDGMTLIAAALEGLGVILVPDWLVRGELDNGQLIEILRGFEPAPPTTPYHALYASGLYTPPKIRAFIDCLVDYNAP